MYRYHLQCIQSMRQLCPASLSHMGSLVDQLMKCKDEATQQEKFCYKNYTFERVIGILVNWHISTGVLMRIARYSH